MKRLVKQMCLEMISTADFWNGPLNGREELPHKIVGLGVGGGYVERKKRPAQTLEAKPNGTLRIGIDSPPYCFVYFFRNEEAKSKCQPYSLHA